MSGKRLHVLWMIWVAYVLHWSGAISLGQQAASITLNQRDVGYRGIWYMNQPSRDEYVYKYSGGLGTYCEEHRPFAIYCKQVNKTFFCYGGAKPDNSRRLLHMVSYYDHTTHTVPRPTILLDKKTEDAHDNPVISLDDRGYLWIFSTSHGTSRPSYIHRSVKPFEIDQFERIPAVSGDAESRSPITNFSYMQVWHRPQVGFAAFFTRYGDPAARTLFFMRSSDGTHWSPWQRLAAIEEGHYQVSGTGQGKLGSMFNYHPLKKGLNARTNLYYLETADDGTTWTTADGKPLTLPLTTVSNAALVVDYAAQGLKVYLKDLRFDEQDHPVLLYITSRGYESGPKNDPRTWTVTRWDGASWVTSSVTTSDNNYDSGELWMFSAKDWRIIAPTQTGPQAYNPGGEIVMWTSHDQGATWQQTKQLTRNSAWNHTYARRVLNGHPDFVAFWADGHARQPSASRLYFCNHEGRVYQLPTSMQADHEAPVEVK